MIPPEFCNRRLVAGKQKRRGYRDTRVPNIKEGPRVGEGAMRLISGENHKNALDAEVYAKFEGKICV